MIWYSVVILLATMVVDVANGNCAWTASPEKGIHTMCLGSEIGRRCFKKNPVYIGKQDQDDIVDQHNLLRQNVASGNQYPYPSAQRMQQMVWDDELAEIAQRWADQCNFNHDKNRDIMRNGALVQVGQNLGLHNAGPGQTIDYRSAVRRWHDEELKDLSADEVANYNFKTSNGHLSQILWGDTNKVGCGISQYTVKPIEQQEDKSDPQTPGPVYLFACNYAPGGNYDGQPIYPVTYNKNEAGSKCDEPSVNYGPLCAPSSDTNAPASGSSNNNPGSGNAQQAPGYGYDQPNPDWSEPQISANNAQPPSDGFGDYSGTNDYRYNSRNGNEQSNTNNQNNNYGNQNQNNNYGNQNQNNNYENQNQNNNYENQNQNNNYENQNQNNNYESQNQNNYKNYQNRESQNSFQGNSPNDNWNNYQGNSPNDNWGNYQGNSPNDNWGNYQGNSPMDNWGNYQNKK